jgi:membrane protein DedA with SNARE-associated domain
MIVLGLSLSALATRYGYPGVALTVFVEGFDVPAPGETAIIAGAGAAGHGQLSGPDRSRHRPLLVAAFAGLAYGFGVLAILLAVGAAVALGRSSVTATKTTT